MVSKVVYQVKKCDKKKILVTSYLLSICISLYQITDKCLDKKTSGSEPKDDLENKPSCEGCSDTVIRARALRARFNCNNKKTDTEHIQQCESNKN